MTKFLVAIAATLCVSTAVMAQDTLHLTLDDALKVALSENISIKVADKEVTRTEYAQKGTYASLFPQETEDVYDGYGDCCGKGQYIFFGFQCRPSIGECGVMESYPDYRNGC